MALNLTSFDAALKQHYTDDRVQRVVYEENPFFAMLNKMENFGGKNLPIPIVFGTPQGRSATFATAQANVGNSAVEDFVITRARDYSVATIDNETIEASKGNANAFIEAMTTEVDGALHSITRSLATALYRNGSGSIGQLSATSGVTTVITLAEIEDVTNFEVGMILVLSIADGGGAVKTGTTKILGIDRELGVITVETSLATFSAVGAVLDFIFVEGDYDAKVSGLDAWLPTAAPSATLFFGVDRTQDSSRLAGVRFNGAGAPIEETLIDGAKRLGREGGAPDKCFMNYLQWANLDKALGSKVQYVDLRVDGLVGFTGIRINGPKGAIDVIPDQNCPNGRAYLLQMNTWKLYSLGRAPRIFDTDGLRVLRQSTADGVEVRAFYYAQLGCRAPGWNAVLEL